MVSNSLGKFTPMKVTIDEVKAALVRNRGLLNPTARDLRVSRAALVSRVSNHDELKVLLAECRESVVDDAENKLFQALDLGEKWAIMLILQSLGKERGYTNRTELTGKNGEDFTFTLNIAKPASLNDDE